jgi:endothelin-converting enzyme
MDTSVDPCDDFYLFANGGWQKKTQIPGDKPAFGVFQAIQENNQVCRVSTRPATSLCSFF